LNGTVFRRRSCGFVALHQSGAKNEAKFSGGEQEVFDADQWPIAVEQTEACFRQLAILGN
jgi:hypothetical protein